MGPEHNRRSGITSLRDTAIALNNRSVRTASCRWGHDFVGLRLQQLKRTDDTTTSASVDQHALLEGSM